MSSETNLSPILLLIEDDPGLRDLLEIALLAEGFEVVVATNGSEGMAALNEEAAHFSGAVTDIELGRGPNGWDAAMSNAAGGFTRVQLCRSWAQPFRGALEKRAGAGEGDRSMLRGRGMDSSAFSLASARDRKNRTVSLTAMSG